MPTNLATPALSGQPTSVVTGPDRVTTDVVSSADVDLSMLRGWVRKAVYDTGWGPDSLSAPEAMDRDKGNISRVLNGERPLSIDFILALPKDVQAEFSALYAKHHGWLVVRPVSPDQAVQNLVSGLLGVLAGNVIGSALRHRQQAKADLREPAKEKVG